MYATQCGGRPYGLRKQDLTRTLESPTNTVHNCTSVQPMAHECVGVDIASGIEPKEKMDQEKNRTYNAAIGRTIFAA